MPRDLRALGEGTDRANRESRGKSALCVRVMSTRPRRCKSSKVSRSRLKSGADRRIVLTLPAGRCILQLGWADWRGRPPLFRWL